MQMSIFYFQSSISKYRVNCLANVKDSNLEIEKLMQNRDKSFRQGKNGLH